ncbi:hypothetical protein [Novosphingobium rosa]|uniref:hypothetical protein n=1 Tax=Novosphingobium rosa TaxID=76978 RepID=UPI000836B79D|nr:hypothetical protein [Novosphingobium rosa]
MANMSDTLLRAAKGDIKAQADMLENTMMTAFQPGALGPQMLGVIEIWARMLASHGSAEDKVKLAGVVIFRASIFRLGGHNDLAQPLIDEGMGLLATAIEEGHEPAEAQRAELSRRLAMNIAIPAEVMLGDLAPTIQ